MPKKVYNNFYFFMLEKKNDYSKKGIKYTMRQISDIAGPMWQKLTPEEKAKYDALAKAYKEENKGVNIHGDRLASDGSKVSEYFEMKESHEKERMVQIREIRTLIGANVVDPIGFKRNIVGMKFYVMEFNIACKIEEDNTFIPIEIGLVEYSIQNGITNSYHKVIDFGPVPTGYFGFCKTHSEDYHKLFLNSEVPKEKNYCKIWDDIMSFICSKERDQLPPPIFTHHDSFEVGQTAGCLQWLMEKAGQMRQWDKMRIWDLSYLLCELRESIDERLSLQVCVDLLRGSSFDYAIGINCDFHEEIDSLYCALGAAKRKCFLLSDTICKLFDVTLTSNHIPNRESANKDYTVYIPQHLAKPEPSVPRTVRVGDKVELTPKPRFDALDDFDDDEEEEEEDPPQPVFNASRLGHVPQQMTNQFANMGLGRGRGIIHK